MRRLQYAAIAETNPEKAQYLDGWNARLDNLQQQIDGSSGSGSGLIDLDAVTRAVSGQPQSVQRAAIKLAREQNTLINQQIKQQQDELEAQAVAHIDNGGTLTNMPVSILSGMTLESRNRIRTFAESDKTSDPVTFENVRGRIVRGQDVRVIDYIDKLSRSDTEELIKLQQDGTGNVYRRMVDDHMALIKPILTAGIEDDAVKAQTVMDFTRQAEAALKGIASDRQPTAQDAQKVVDMLMMQGTITRNDDSFGAAFSRAFNPLSDVNIASENGKPVLRRSNDGMMFQAQPGERFTIPGVPYFEGNRNISGIELNYEEMVQQIADSLRRVGLPVNPATIAAKYNAYMERSANE